MILAVIFEFTGAIVLGRVSAETIAGGIAKQETFKENAPAFAYGMSITLWLGFLWQAYASYMVSDVVSEIILELPAAWCRRSLPQGTALCRKQ